jgi:Aspartate decarboxylase
MPAIIADTEVASPSEFCKPHRSSMLLKMMKSKIHRAKVTRADLNDEGSIGIDEYLLRAADLLLGRQFMSGT